jgi:hypothetical protein
MCLQVYHSLRSTLHALTLNPAAPHQRKKAAVFQQLPSLSFSTLYAPRSTLNPAAPHQRKKAAVSQQLPPGWKMGLEPTTFGTTIRRSNRLSYIHRFGVQNKSKISISQNFGFLFSCQSMFAIFAGFKKKDHAEQFNHVLIVLRKINNPARIEEDQTDRQYLRTPAVPTDEAGYLPYNQHRIYKETHPRRDR